VVSACYLRPCPRIRLGIMCSTGGSLTGTLTIANGRALDSVVPNEFYTFCGNPDALLALTLSENRARYLVVLEKETVLVDLSQTDILTIVPIALATSRGYPPLHCRAGVKRFAQVCACFLYCLLIYGCPLMIVVVPSPFS